MPFLYKNTNIKTMKKREEITREDWEAIKKHKLMTSYSNAEIAELFNLVRNYVDPRQATCVTCTANLREAKNKLNEFYHSVAGQIDAIFAAQEKPVEQIDELTQAKEQVDEYSQTEEPEQKKRGRKKKE